MFRAGEDGSIQNAMRIVNVGIDDLSSDQRNVHAYWDSLRDDRIAPSWREIELVKLPSNLLPTTMVVDIRAPLEQSIFRYWGSKLTEIHGVDMTSRHPYDLTPPEFGKQLLTDHRTVIERKKPMGWHYSFLAAGGYMHSHGLIRLPLSNDNEQISHIIVVADYSREALELIRLRRDKYAEATGRDTEQPLH